MNEKISFLFPFTRVGTNNNGLIPVLTYECDIIPVKATLDVAFYFICLKNNEVYRLWFDIIKDGKPLMDDSWDREKDFTAEDPKSEPGQIAVGLNVNLPGLPFESEGIYCIVSKLFSLTTNTLVDEREAFFKVKRKSE